MARCLRQAWADDLSKVKSRCAVCKYVCHMQGPDKGCNEVRPQLVMLRGFERDRAEVSGVVVRRDVTREESGSNNTWRYELYGFKRQFEWAQRKCDQMRERKTLQTLCCIPNARGLAAFNDVFGLKRLTKEACVNNIGEDGCNQTTPAKDRAASAIQVARCTTC